MTALMKWTLLLPAMAIACSEAAQKAAPDDAERVARAVLSALQRGDTAVLRQSIVSRTYADPGFARFAEHSRQLLAASTDSLVLTFTEVTRESGKPLGVHLVFRTRRIEASVEAELWLERREEGYKVESIKARPATDSQ